MGTPGLALVTFFKRVASLGRGTHSDSLGSKTVEGKLQPLEWISVGRMGRVETAAPPTVELELELGPTRHCRSSGCLGRGLRR